ncbi:MAG TPA: hypothetical protein VFU15_15360 [Bacteroidia bacterium]|nr:hypothetical protein [Bacteroidia bacterium]
MKEKMRIVLLCAVATFVSARGLFAQKMPASFTADNVKFIDEMKDFFESYDGKAGRDFIDDFNQNYWMNGKVSDDIKQAMFKNTNQMCKKKFRPSPEYYSYFNTIKAIVDKNFPMTTFLDWQSCFTSIGNGKLGKPFSDYILMSESLFGENKFYKTATGEWSVTGGTWKFACDSVPSVRFSDVTLKGNAKNDSTRINGTSGTYYPTNGMWIGKGGRIDWQRAGLKEDDAYADLKNYSFPVKGFVFIADSVTFYNKKYFKDKPLTGRLTEKLVADAKASTAAYPRFESYSSRYQIKSMYPNVDYEGGFTQVGAKFIGSGTPGNPAFFIFKRNGKNFLQVTSQSFAITDQKVTSQNSAIKFSFDADSIVHPSVDFKYFVDSSRVVLYRPDEGASRAPYYDSFHKVDMFVEQIIWKTNEPTIVLNTVPGSTVGEASFPSVDYYRQYLYDQLQGIEPVHPLIKIRNFVRDVNGGVKTFTMMDLAKYWKISVEELRPTIMNLSNQGFLLYDPVTDMITYKDKCDTYIAARAGKKDYDNIIFESKVQPGTPNAKINLLNYDMTLFGVKEIGLSDSQNVVVFPNQDMVVLKKNRNFTFEGSIMAGRFDYYGKLFSFDYNTFKLSLNNVDSVRIWVDTPQRDPRDPKGGFVQMKVRSVIENLNGELQIDASDNKSGVKNKGPYAKYPIFTSAKPAFVYYDKPGIQKGVYNRDKFYFKLDPFTIDSLDNFQNSALHFVGTFQSSGIFPEIRDTLRLMPDYSLGFVRQAPPGGYPVYGGKAKFTNEMRLSNQGLRGDGQIDYITSTSISKDFIFFPDSMNGVAQSFTMKEQKIQGKTEYPQVNGPGAYIHYMPKKDYLNATSRDSAFSVFNGKSTFTGTMTLSPKSLEGNGKLDFSNAELTSKKMVLKQHVADADTADFDLKALALAGLAFSTKNVNAHVDFEKREGDFKANGKGSIVTFPVNQYICYMENFKWYMDQDQIEMSSNKPKPGEAQDKIALQGPEFISIHPKQDSLRFRAPKAKYDLKNYIIHAEGVQEILVADARIIPDSGNVVIQKGAYMETLTNAQLQANTITNYHKLFNCVIDVYSRHSYTASGDYAYVDELKKEQIIHFAKIAPDTTGQTYAQGTIADTSKFYLSPAFDFRGNVILAANNQFLVFDGSTSLTNDCGIDKARLQFKGEINPDEIYIPVSDNPVTDKGDPITSGLMSTVSADSVHIYGSFLSPKKGKTDVSVVSADGFLFFDKTSREYRISNKEKLVERSLPGNYVSFNTKNCTIYGEGRMALGADLGKVLLTPIGNATHNTVDHSTSFDLVMGIDFFIPEKLLNYVLDDIDASTSLAGTDPTRTTFQHALTEMVGKERADKLISNLTVFNSYKKFPDELKYTFFFTDVQMNWNQKTKAYISDGKLGLGNSDKKEINKFVPGTIMLERVRSGDRLTIYFELDNGKWYTFYYANGMMSAYSSNTKFMDELKAMKDDDKVAPDDYDKDRLSEKGQKAKYKITAGGPQDLSRLKNKLKKASDGGDDSGGGDGDDSGNK